MPRHKPTPPTKYPSVKVVFFNWINSDLEVVEDLVDDLQEAIHKMENTSCHTYKVYDRHGHVVRSGNGGNYHSHYHHHHHHDDSPYC